MKVTLSSKFQITIPKKAREQSGFKAGDEVRVIAHQGRIKIERIQDEPIENFRGRYKFLTPFEREPDREV